MTTETTPTPDDGDITPPGILAMEHEIDLVDELVTANRLVNAHTAARLRLVQKLRAADAVTQSHFPNSARELGHRSFHAEVACALHMSEKAAQNLIGISSVLADHLPTTFAAFDNGDFSYTHVQIIVDHVAGLDDTLTAELERKVLPKAATLTPPRFDDYVRRAREALDPDSIEARQETAFDTRTTIVEPGRDGMAYLTLFTKATHLHGIDDRLRKAALSIRNTGDPRTLAQIRADLAVQVLLSSDGAIDGDCPPLDDSDAVIHWFRGITPTVIVTVPVLSLLGQEGGVAQLDGYGPISMADAKILAAKAPSFRRILTHPVTGATLAVERKQYKVPKDLREWLRTRDGTCRFPGCGRLAKYCDIDHTEEWQHGGHTNHDNLAHLCRSHHTLKTEDYWQVTQHPDGTGQLTWTSPTGRNYTTEPATQLPH